MGTIVRFDDPMLRRLKLSDLRMFYAVVERGGMAKAAAQLNVTQPAVSKAISALERSLGVRLLDRSSQGVEPTMYGRALLKGGVAAFDELQQSLRQIAFLSDASTGELRIGCSEYGATGIVAAAVDQISRRFPGINFHVVTADLNTLVDRELTQRNIELALSGGANQISRPDIEIEVLFLDRQVIVAGRRSKWTRRRDIPLKDLIDEPWILPPPDSWVGAAIRDAFRWSGLAAPATRVASYSIPLCYQMLATGRFLSTQPMVMARLARDLPIKALDVDFQGAWRPVGIMTLKGRTLGPLAQLFIETARDLAKSLPKAQ